jgi:hypothetical protein
MIACSMRVGVRSLFGRIPWLSLYAYQDEVADATFSKCTLSPVALQYPERRKNSNLSTPSGLQLALCNRPQMGRGRGNCLTSRSTLNRIPLGIFFLMIGGDCLQAVERVKSYRHDLESHAAPPPTQ